MHNHRDIRCTVRTQKPSNHPKSQVHPCKIQALSIPEPTQQKAAFKHGRKRLKKQSIQSQQTFNPQNTKPAEIQSPEAPRHRLGLQLQRDGIALEDGPLHLHDHLLLPLLSLPCLQNQFELNKFEVCCFPLGPESGQVWRSTGSQSTKFDQDRCEPQLSSGTQNTPARKRKCVYVWVSKIIAWLANS